MSRVTWVFLGPTPPPPRFVTITHVTVTLGIGPTPRYVTVNAHACVRQYIRTRTQIHTLDQPTCHAHTRRLAHPCISCLLGENNSCRVCVSKDLADEEQNWQVDWRNSCDLNRIQCFQKCVQKLRCLLHTTFVTDDVTRSSALPHFSRDVRLILLYSEEVASLACIGLFSLVELVLLCPGMPLLCRFLAFLACLVINFIAWFLSHRNVSYMSNCHVQRSVPTQNLSPHWWFSIHVKI